MINFRFIANLMGRLLLIEILIVMCPDCFNLW